jgi:hypothetical protein
MRLSRLNEGMRVARKQIGLALDPELLDRVDEARGLVSRAAWIAAACEEKLTPLLMVSEDGGTPVPVRHVHRSTVVEEASEPARTESRAGKPNGQGSPPAPASPRPSIDELQRQGLVRPASSLGAKANVRPIPKGE